MGKKRQKKQSSPEPVEDQQMDYVRNDEFIMERKGAERCSMNIAVGDHVIMTNKYPVGNDIIGLIWKVTEGPKYLQGKRRVRLEGYQGWYPADGLRVVG